MNEEVQKMRTAPDQQPLFSIGRMDENVRTRIITELNRFVSGETNYHELQIWLDYGDASELAERLKPKERRYYSWMRQRLDQAQAEELPGSAMREIVFFIRLLNGQVSWCERVRRWWGF